MTITCGSGQTSGQPLSITATSLAGAQVLHTFPAGGATPSLAEVYAFNSNLTKGILLTLAVYDSLAALVRSWSIFVPAGANMFPCFDTGEEDAELIMNGTSVLKAYADTTAVLGLCARVDDQVATVNTVTFASGQTSGQPLVITAITLGTAQTIHTFPSGTNKADILQLFGFNSASDAGKTLHLALYDVGATLIRAWDEVIGASSALQPLLGIGEEHAALICNGTSVLKGYADAASVVAVCGRVTTQAAP